MYEELVKKLREIRNLDNMQALATWDKETYMPSGASDDRGEMLATLTKIKFEKFTEKNLYDLVNKLLDNQDLEDIQKKNLTVIKEDIEKINKLSSQLLEKIALQKTKTNTAWKKARQEEDFSIFAKEFQKLLDLRLEEANLVGYEDNLYDYFLHEFDPWTKTYQLDEIFQEFKPKLKELIDKVKTIDPKIQELANKRFNKDKIKELVYEVLEELGYDFDKGRLDISVHPFTRSISLNDARITTRLGDGDLIDCLTTTIHEMGHALYHLGVDKSQYGLPAGEIRSLALHESQSMIWELYIAKNPKFWERFFPKLSKYFPKEFEGYDYQDFVKLIHNIQPSLIRTSADQLTYHMHIIIRYEMERDLLAGKIKVEDMPKIWNQKYYDYLGVQPTTLKEGILQDPHWANAEFGYFPTYSLGNMYASWIYQNMDQQLGLLDKIIANGEFEQIKSYLSNNIHKKGSVNKSLDVINSLAEDNFSVDKYINFMEEKLNSLGLIE
ncbi:carboxypeptidase M32 [Candidatus Absconditicoccus praedator]|uniref:carboxypeptidase M32 n=1 Tax=Candidatus Absconditicoccus praedator TaxID=2735562 RepID=UPI001E45A8BC|nr:carboxypeptidase M32 [Candidatus Absconditicoccus praedator]UFX82693.1 carboxypeptidase M32 [Candidatus Absconditicoccus praedator]